MSEKYNAKVALKPSKPHHGCDVFDTRIKEDICNGQSAGFKQKIDDLLNLIQGPWGSYGNDIE